MKKKQKVVTTGNAESILETAKFYFLSSKYEEAITEFKKALAINPGSTESYYHLGLIFEHRNKLELAKDMYEKALTIDQKHKLAREHLNKLIGI